MKLYLALGSAAILLLLTNDSIILAQSTAFTYQGKLTSQGVPVSGSYDFVFSLFDDPSAGNALGGRVTNSAVQVVAGAFSVLVDFGTNFPGPDRWIEIGVRTNGNGSFTTLSPRQQVTPTPYAITAANLSGPIAQAQLGSLTNHTDVSAGGLSAGQVLIYSGALWTNAPSPAGVNSTNLSPVVLSYSGTNVPVNAAAGSHFRLVATNNFLLQNPTGTTDGQRLMFELIQDATGGRTLTFGSSYKFGLDLPAGEKQALIAFLKTL